jgi:hypothetical protein
MATPPHKPARPVDDHLYGLFFRDGNGPLCRGFFADLEKAKVEAQRLAEKDGYEYFIFDLLRYVEVARIPPLNQHHGSRPLP